jgi:hypothetical protein
VPCVHLQWRGFNFGNTQDNGKKEHWLQVRAKLIDNNDVEYINISALHIETLLPQANEPIQEQTMLDDKYWEIVIAPLYMMGSGPVNTRFI